MTQPELRGPVGAATIGALRPGWTTALLVLLGLLAYTALLRLPFAGDIGDDEVFFVLVAQRWLQGLLPYVSSFDVKPPGLFALFALAQATFGTSIATVKGLETVCVALTAGGLWLIGVRHLSSGVGRFAALCYPVYSLALTGVHAPVELVKAPFETLAMLAALEAGRRPDGRWRAITLAGVLMGAAVMVKQTAAFAAVGLLATLLARRVRPLPAIASFVAGGAVVPGCFVLLFAAQGALGPFLDGAIWGAMGRMRGDSIRGEPVSFMGGVLSFLPLSRPLLVLMCASALTLTRALRLRGGPMMPATAVALVWLACEAAGILAVPSMYFNYFLALVPPLSLLAGLAVQHLIDWPPVWRWWLVTAVTLLVLAYPVLLDRRGIAPGVDRAGPAAVSRALKAAGLPATAPILVLERGLLVYLDAHRPPPGRYFHPQHLVCDFPTPDLDPMAVALAEHPAAIVLADRGRGLTCGRPDRFAELSAALETSYCFAGHIQGETDAFDLFLARQPGATPHSACGG